MWMLHRREYCLRLRSERLLVCLDFDAQHFRPLAAIDGKHTVWWQFIQRFLELEIIAKFLPLLLGDFGLCTNQLPGALDDLPQAPSQIRPLAEIFRQNVPDSQ